MKDFSKMVRELFFKEKGIDIDTVEYMDMPESRNDYDLSKVIGNVNLIEGRFMIKSEADVIVEHFLSSQLL